MESDGYLYSFVIEKSFNIVFLLYQHFRVKSSRWNDTTNRKRAVSHTMIICDKPIAGKFPRPLALLENQVPGILTDKEDADLKKIAEDVSSF